MFKKSCNQLPDTITLSRIFCDFLSQCANVSVLQGLRSAREEQCSPTDEEDFKGFECMKTWKVLKGENERAAKENKGFK